ncbi:DUF5721 family protein [Eubacterium sp.]|uniref:DUF5721 family protein n=1 Tax=Eubacterium sp. TaxID=142586 RepID=UPI0025901473|nr:DUF5721 family protein [Eubacterium sp.]MCR5368801.1 DUF5721 family protein [Eubacterium sp.]
MISENIENVKGLVSRLLSDEIFANMLLYSLEVKNAYLTEVSGKMNKEFFDSSEEAGAEEYIRWSDVRELFFQSIKGSRLPLKFKIVLLADSLLIEKIGEAAEIQNASGNIASLGVNIYYDRNGLSITSGTSLKLFTMDKSVEKCWDEWVRKNIVG